MCHVQDQKIILGELRTWMGKAKIRSRETGVNEFFMILFYDPVYTVWAVLESDGFVRNYMNGDIVYNSIHVNSFT